MTDLTKAEEEAIALLPYPLASAAIKCVMQNKGSLNEIRLRLGQQLAVTSRGKNLLCNIRCTRDDIDGVLRRLCQNSLYSHADTLREGYITCGSIRAGVCGRAVTDSGRISAVTDIVSVNIRVPHRVRGAADSAYKILESCGFSSGMLIYSKPGVGKTTVLRELTVKLSKSFRVALVDTRCEIMAGIEEGGMTDVLSSYPRAKGIEIAMRTLSPEFIICDEISSEEDVAAVTAASGSGVHVIATAHADNFDGLMNRRGIRQLDELDVFGIYLGLLARDASGSSYVTEVSVKQNSVESETVSSVKL